MSLNIIGIAAHFHDSSCCLLQAGKLVAAAEEERFSRVKFDPSIPKNALRYCLGEAGLSMADIDCLAYYENPIKKLGRQLWMGLPGMNKRGAAVFKMDARRPAREIREILGYDGPVDFVDHHLSHAASSYFYSGFQDAAIMTVDGVGEWATSSYCRANGNKIVLFQEVDFPDSLGLLYSTITSYLGFSVNSDEYKVMGLAPYGKPSYLEEIRTMIKKGPAGEYQLEMRYFDFLRNNRMYSDDLVKLFGHPPRPAESKLLKFHHDLARSLQIVLEEILLQKIHYMYEKAPSDNLCMAGGVALNCVANGRLKRDGPFRNIFVQPAANDAGGSLGAAALTHLRLTGERPHRKRMRHACLGPSFSQEEIKALLDATPLDYKDFCNKTEALYQAVVDRLTKGGVIGWFQGRMEFGPRALGSRSILADPRIPDMRDRINALVKKREGFRPFAPAVLADLASEHFELDHPSPFMLEVCQVNSKFDLPAITHVDGSARVQTVSDDENPKFAGLLREFHHKTGCPILLNTSFNMRDEPIVCQPSDAIRCFTRSQIDTLILGDFLIDRASIPEFWPKHFELFHSFQSPAISHKVYSFF